MENRKRNRDREAMIQAGVNNSPYYQHVGMRVKEFTEQGSVMEMPVAAAHKNIWGAMHGGAISSLVDSSCGTAIGPWLLPEVGVVTLDLRVQFMRPVREGLLTAYGRVVHRTQRYIIAESEVFDQDHNLVARGSTIHTLISRPTSKLEGE